MSVRTLKIKGPIHLCGRFLHGCKGFGRLYGFMDRQLSKYLKPIFLYDP